jgi:hypothetical protein
VATERLYHYTCAHSYDGIRRELRLECHEHPLMPDVGPVLWLTDLDSPDRSALGLTSRIIRCDRTEFRAIVEAEAEHWPVFARRLPRAVRTELESATGARPMHWYVSLKPVDVLSIEPVEIHKRSS